jgi:large-conductance mechanosensitive channel
MSLSESEAKLKMAVFNSNAMEFDRIDAITQLTNSGLPQEIITRIDELWEKTKIIGGQVVHIGRIILAEIMKFIKENPHLAVGVAIGAAVGALISMIPFFGPILAPLATAISVIVGGIAGYRLDQGQKPSDDVIGVTQELILVAKKFFELFANIFNALSAQVS